MGITDIHPARISDRSGRGMPDRTVLLYESTGSSNSVALLLAGRGAPEGTVVIASSQTKGRGRKGRVWYSSPIDSLTFSIILYPAGSCESLTLVLALSAARHISQLGVEASMKWPNDIWTGGRKVAGILAEMRKSSLVLGMGLNVNNVRDTFPELIEDSAVSLRIATGRAHDRGVVLRGILDRFEENYKRWKRDGFAPFKDPVEEILLWKGEGVRIESREGPVSGTMLGIDGEGRLMIEDSSGTRKLSAGDLVLIQG